MADEPAQSLAGEGAVAVIHRGTPGGPWFFGRTAFADRDPRPMLSSYAAWVHPNQPMPSRLYRYAQPTFGMERW